jgi:hypothetical protein
MSYGYLGEEVVDAKDTPYADYTASDWAMEFIERYGGIDGDHHKLWLLDRVARLLKGAPVEVRLAKWDSGHEEYRFSIGTSDDYEEWVEYMKGWNEEEGEYDYSYDWGDSPP